MNCSVVIPTYKGAKYLPFALKGLASQSYKNFEAIFVIKPSGDGTEELVERMCEEYALRYKIVMQERGCVTHALNLGMKYVNGDIVLFTDDDAIFPLDWIEKHLMIHTRLKHVGAVSSHLLYYDLDSKRVSRTEIERPLVNLHRRLLRPVLERPHKLFQRFRWGVYITTNYKVAAGSYVPYRPCLSLPCRGVNMSFKLEAIKYAYFPEHPALKVAPNYEQFVGAQIVLEGWDTFYTPNVSVYHIVRKSLSRGKKDKELKSEILVMQNMFQQLVESKRSTNVFLE